MAATDSQSARPLALITGASSGIGAVFARKLAERGYDLVLVARRQERLASLAQELGQRHGTYAEPFIADLADDNQLAALERRIGRAPNLEFVVNNAGFGTLPLFHEAEVASQERMHRVHVLATLRLTRAALAGMVARKRGFIVNVSSVAGFTQGPGNISYCATKAWMNSFTEGLYLEMRALGVDVRVQALCPGFTETEFHESMGIGRSFVGKSWWMTAEEVVDASLRGLERGQWLVIPRLRYKLIFFALKHLPRSVFHALAKLSPASRRRQAERGRVAVER